MKNRLHMSASLSANKFIDVAYVFKHDFTCHQAGGRSRLRCSWSVTKNVTRRKAKQSLIKKKFLNTRFLARFPAQKNAGCTNASHDFPPRKYNVLLPQTGWLLTPFLPPKESTDGWRTLTSEQKFLGWIDYQIFLGMELRSRTWSFAIKKIQSKSTKTCTVRKREQHRVLFSW